LPRPEDSTSHAQFGSDSKVTANRHFLDTAKAIEAHS
jgi:hypothetical protein